MFPKWLAAGIFILSLEPGFGQECQIKDEVVPSQWLGTARAIHVCLPASYQANPHRRYPVFYVQDGQNIFSTAGTNCAFGWGSWQLDKTAAELARDGEMQEIIIVAVDNSANRMEAVHVQSEHVPFA